MAHPYESSRADKVGKSRAGSFTKGYKLGGAVNAYKAGGAVAPKKVSGGEVKVAGRASGGRLDKFARGGRSKGKHGTQVNIAVVQPKGGSPSPDGAPAGGPLPAPGGPLSMMPPKPPPPPMPPPGPPGKPPGMMKRGGKVTGQKGGAETGVGRLNKVKMYGAKAK